MKCIIRKNCFGEFEVPTQVGMTGADQISYQDDREAAEDTARFVHGQDVEIKIVRGTYTLFGEDA